MAITVQHSEQFMLEIVRKEHDLEDDTLKIALMNTTFSFDPETHATWADCSSDEITAGNGYTAGGETLTNVSASISGGQVDIAADSITWTATGGAIPTTGAAIIYNSTHANSTVYKCIDFGADYDTAQDKLFQINLTNGLGYVAEAS